MSEEPPTRRAVESDHLVALPAGTRLGKYRLDAVLGHGGFGITYRAFDTALDRAVAIKEYLPSDVAVRLDGTTVQAKSRGDSETFEWGLTRFLDEAKSLAKFENVPAVVRVYDYLQANGTAYMVMALVEGETLSAVYGRERTLNQVRLLAILLPMLDGLDAVHRANVLHRDIKPSNIVLRPDGSPVLLDFGAARSALGDKSRSMTAVFTPGYAPFEQYMSAGRQGPWTDIYALAATLYHGVTGKVPPPAAERVYEDPMPAAAAAGAGRYDGWFLAAIDRGLAVQEKMRPQSVAEWRSLFSAAAPAGAAATQVVRGAIASPASPAAPLSVAASAPSVAGKRPSALFVGGGGAALVLAGVAAFLMFGNPSAKPPEVKPITDKPKEVLIAEAPKAPPPPVAAAPRPPVTVAPPAPRGAALPDAMAELRRQADEARRQAEAMRGEIEAAKRLAEATRSRADEDARQRAVEDARRRAEEETRKQAEAERLKAEELARQQAATEARKKAEEEGRNKAVEEETRRKADADTRKKADEEAKRKTDEEARKKAEVDAKAKLDAEAKKKAEEEAKKKAQQQVAAAPPPAAGQADATAYLARHDGVIRSMIAETLKRDYASFQSGSRPPSSVRVDSLQLLLGTATSLVANAGAVMNFEVFNAPVKLRVTVRGYPNAPSGVELERAGGSDRQQAAGPAPQPQAAVAGGAFDGIWRYELDCLGTQLHRNLSGNAAVKGGGVKLEELGYSGSIQANGTGSLAGATTARMGPPGAISIQFRPQAGNGNLLSGTGRLIGGSGTFECTFSMRR